MNKQEIMECDSARLTDILIKKQSEAAELKREIDMMKGELQTRGLKVLDERNSKFIEFYGKKEGIAAVTISQKMEVLNYFKLRELLGEAFTDEKIKRIPADIKYDIDPKFSSAMIALITNDFESEVKLDEVLDKITESINQKKVLQKKLKGDYKKDRKTVADVLGIPESNLNLEAELFFIGKIKNWQLITTFFDEKNLKEIQAELKKCIAVDETVKISAKSTNEENIA